MTPEQRLDRVENILRHFIKAGRRARAEWNYKINSLIDAQIRNETAWRAESQAINEQIHATNEHIKELAKSQKLTDRALRAFINERRKGANGKSSK